ncbi:MAG: hypothetical protein V4754_06970 [Pseudomonadota bacterium]
MTSVPNDRKISTEQPVKNDQQHRLPHERDESPQGETAAPRDVMKQAASDLERGLVDTDLHGQRGVEKVKPGAPQQAAPVTPEADGKRTP